MPPPSPLPILVVDDDEPTRNLLQAVLRRCGLQSEVAVNGKEAIARLEKENFAAVILDMMMPGVFGGEVIDFLAGRPSPIPVVVCSAAGPKALTGFDARIVKAVVRKPFDIDELTDAIRAAVLHTA